MSENIPSRKSGISRSTLLLIAGLLLFATVTTVAVLQLQAQQKIKASLKDAQPKIGAFPIVVPTLKYGFALDTFQVKEGVIAQGDFLGNILAREKMDYQQIEQLVTNSKEVFNVRNFRLGRPYLVLSKDTTSGADYFIYEPSVYEYVVFDLKDLSVEKVKRSINSEIRSTAGVIESSLWNAMSAAGASPDLIVKMEDALQWSIDFHHLQKGDQYKLVYDQNFIEGQAVGPGMVKAAYYKTGDQEHWAVYHESEDGEGYYDFEGRPMNKGFLKSPVKYSRISSYYNLNRFHPILKRRRPHLGTDYAAPYNTPIYAVGNGVITNAAYTKGNGNYVKIKHDDTYQTQYLHMNKFGPGIRAGVHVKQGQVIGYVGSTGLATGPHVCFRFWKNGKQVNHLNLSFPPPEPLPKEELPAFFAKRDSLLKMMQGLEFKNSDPEEQADAVATTEQETEEQPADADNP